jgi:hypothetical protein
MLPPYLSPTQLHLEFSSADRDRAWQQSQTLATAGDRWTAYLNRLCVNTLLPWLQAEHYPDAKVWPSPAALPRYWTLVNGTACTTPLGRLVLLPTEVIDDDEWVVPQEWVDLPRWVADYYWPVQVEPDELWLRVEGYTTQAQLKAQAQFDVDHRTYRLTGPARHTDVSVLWLSHSLCPAEATQVPIAPLPALALPQANHLIQRLGNAALLTPRLAVPFSLWGALLQHDGWHQSLYERRQGQDPRPSLRQWLQTGLSEWAQQLGWERLELQLSAGGARGSESDAAASGETAALLSRRLTIEGQPYDLQIRPLPPPSATADTLEIWRVELRSALPGGQIPAGVVLRLLTEDLQPFDDNQATAVAPIEVLFLEVALEPGEGLVWEIEPRPEQGDREILRI